jgi:hypothetical protein
LEIGMSILMAMIGLLIIVLMATTHDYSGVGPALGACGLAIFFWVGFITAFIPLGWLRYRWNPRFRDPYTVTIDEEQIRIKTPMSDLHLSWSYYQRAIEGRQTFLLVAERNFVSMIPKRVFRDEEEVAAFKEFLARKIGR